MRARVTSVAIAFAVVACAQGGFAPSALPQQLPAVPWTYVSPLGDTVAGRLAIAIDTVVPRIVHAVHVDTVPGPVVHDTLYCVAGVCSSAKPPVATGDSTVKDTVVKAVRGVPFAPAYFPAESLGPAYAYGGAVIAGDKPFAKYQAKRAKVILAVPRSSSLTSGPLISVANATKEIKSWDSTAIARGIADGTVAGFMASDDITGKEVWGPDVPYFAQIDSIGCAIKKRWPTGVTYVRARPAEMRYAWKCVDGSWSQYSARYGSVNAYIATVLADLATLSKTSSLHCNLFALNVLNGGDGSSKLAGTQTGKYQMTGAELVAYAGPMLKWTPVLPSWSWGPAQSAASVKGFDRRPDVMAAYLKLKAQADTTPVTSCRLH